MKQARTILLAGAGEELRLLLNRAAANLPTLRIDEAPGIEPQALNGKAVACDVLVAEVDLNSASSTDAFARLAGSTSDRKVVAAARNAGPEDVRRLFRAGAADVLTFPLDPAMLQATLGDILKNDSGSGDGGQIITVIRGCGGAGATTLAINLAALMTRPERKSAQPKTAAILDFDLQFGDADLALNLEPRSTLIDVLRAESRFDGRLLQSAMVEHSSGLRLLASPPSLVPLDALNPGFARQIVTQSAQLHDYTFIDLPCVWADWTLSLLQQSSLLVLLTPPTVQGAMGARRVLQAVKEAGVTAPVLFVLNKMAGIVEAFEKPSRIGKSMNRTVDCVLSLDPTATRAFDRGALLVDAFPKARLTRELHGLAAKIGPALAQAQRQQPEFKGAAA